MFEGLQFRVQGLCGSYNSVVRTMYGFLKVSALRKKILVRRSVGLGLPAVAVRGKAAVGD